MANSQRAAKSLGSRIMHVYGTDDYAYGGVVVVTTRMYKKGNAYGVCVCIRVLRVNHRGSRDDLVQRRWRRDGRGWRRE